MSEAASARSSHTWINSDFSVGTHGRKLQWEFGDVRMEVMLVARIARRPRF
jgi:hypothetical protein